MSLLVVVKGIPGRDGPLTRAKLWRGVLPKKLGPQIYTDKRRSGTFRFLISVYLRKSAAVLLAAASRQTICVAAPEARR